MKTSNPQDSNRHVFISKELQGRIDTGHLFEKEEVAPEETEGGAESRTPPDQATIIFSSLPYPCKYQLSAWSSDSVTVIVPPSHLERFFSLRGVCADMILFGETFLCVDSQARKKDGDWFVTISLRS